ncbi:MAG: hypothetical protein OHK0029_27430 [Armatimonadaceae bacterium]
MNTANISAKNRTEGHVKRMNQRAFSTRRSLGGIVALGVALAAVAAPTPAVYAQTMSEKTTTLGPQAKLPNNVLLFPAVITGEGGAVVEMTPQTQQLQEIVTEAVRNNLARGGVRAVVYSNRLPSIQRAVAEGQGLKPEDAARGPMDDARLASRFAEIVGASEYVVVSVDNYSFDPQSRRATFNLTLIRSETSGASLATSAEKAVGEAPADVPNSLREGSAAARASELAAEKSVINIYPQSAVLINPPKPVEQKKKRKSPLSYIIPAAALGILLLVPR